MGASSSAGRRIFRLPVGASRYLRAMRWFARPENTAQQLRVAPRLASWNKADHPDQVRLRAYLDDTKELLAGSRIDGPWALRLDVGLSAMRDLLDGADLDNYAYPLALHLQDPGLVSVWCTKQHSERSLVRIDAAREVAPPSTDVLVAKTNTSASTIAFKEQIRAAVAGVAELPPGPVRLELSFVVGTRRKWLNLWKQTIDSLDPFLGRTYADRPWHPRDGRITELGMHLTVDPAARYEVAVGISASAGRMSVSPYGRLDLNDRVLIDQPGTRDHRRVATVVGLGPGDGTVLEIGQFSFGGPPISKLSVIDKRIPEGAVITDLVGHEGSCRDTEGTPGRCDVIMARGYTTPDDRELRSFRCGQPCQSRLEEGQLVLDGLESQGEPQPVGPTSPESQEEPIGEAQVTLRAAARANGWQVLGANNREDRYLLPGDPVKRIRVTWSAGGDVLFAYGGERIAIYRMDGFSDPSAKTERVLSALTARTDAIPPHAPNVLAVGQDGTSDAMQESPVGGPVDNKLRPEPEVGVRGLEPREFRDDDAGYRAWLYAHPDGYVINIRRDHSATAARVHHAGCRTISGQNPLNGPWTGRYVKVCATQLADLEQWATDHVRDLIPPCGICRPGSTASVR